MNGLGRCQCEERWKLQESNRLIVVGTTSKKIAPVRWRTALAQPSMLDSGIESISGSIATTCLSETWRPHARWKKRLLKLFVVWCRNCSLKKWQNVRRFGTWMSKTHGCVNPCYHVFGGARGISVLRSQQIYQSRGTAKSKLVVASSVAGCGWTKTIWLPIHPSFRMVLLVARKPRFCAWQWISHQPATKPASK